MRWAACRIITFLLFSTAITALLPNLTLHGNVTAIPPAFPDVSLPSTRTTPPEPYATSTGHLYLVFSSYGARIPLNAFTLLYIDNVNDIWHAVASEKNTQPSYPERKPVDNQVWLYEEHGFQLMLKQTDSAAVAWEYGELWETVTLMMGFAVKFGGMVEMDVEGVAGPGNFEGYLKWDGRGRGGRMDDVD
ncbi:hypothetical protein ACLMJK_003282 [Lecanora helva]